jgi:ribonuclease T1
MRRRWPQLATTAIVLLLALAVLLLNNQQDDSNQPTPTPAPASVVAAARTTATPTPPRSNATAATTSTQRPTTTRTTAAAARTPTPDGTLPTITYTQLPVEARETIRLIDQGGPFPYERDGITFGNRERLLPIQSDGYYREYTVITPGSSDRGARRIVAGRSGDLYYTDDHYESFKRVIR